MTRQQKLILFIFGSVDIAIIALLGSVIVASLRTPPPTPVIQAEISPCTQQVLGALPDAWRPTVAWDQDQLYLTATVIRSDTPSLDDNADDTAQCLWTALDGIALVLKGDCPSPETITIAITVQGKTETYHHLAQLAGDDVLTWIHGDLSEGALAARARYRMITETASRSP